MNTYKVLVYSTNSQSYETYQKTADFTTANTIVEQLEKEGTCASVECDLVYTDEHHETRDTLVTWLELVTVIAVISAMFFH